jgi:acyl-CoA reductase-like NAD-dependent aldehyde dehydrogenase
VEALPALVSGNTCVIKPAEDTPLSTYNLVQTLIDAGLPPGVVNIVSGYGPEAGAPLVEHPDVRAISFTGSSAVGSLVGQRAASQLQARLARNGRQKRHDRHGRRQPRLALEGALWGAFGTTGQRCTATSRILLHKSIAAEFTSKLVARAAALKVGNGLDDGIEVGPQVNAAADRDFSANMSRSPKPKAQSSSPAASHSPTAPTPTALLRAHRLRISNRRDAHRPRRSLRPRRLPHRVQHLRRSHRDRQLSIDYGLSTSLYTKDVNRAFTAIRDLEAGITYINAPTIGAEVHLPFGGVKQTGNGHREGTTARSTSTPPGSRSTSTTKQ